MEGNQAPLAERELPIAAGSPTAYNDEIATTKMYR
jgi:hypothetical protein